jgi:hypothetical protein
MQTPHKLSAWQAVREGWDMVLHCSTQWRNGLLHSTLFCFFKQTGSEGLLYILQRNLAAYQITWNKVFVTTYIMHVLLPHDCFFKYL